VERVIAPDSTILLDYMLHRFTNLIKRLLVYPENMLKNLEKTRGLIHSQRILLELAKKGLNRNKAYQMAQRDAMRCLKEASDFKEIVLADTEIRANLSEEEIEEIFDLDYHTRYIDQIFERVFKE
jgi:adenylosuccinate lyase